MQNNPYHDEYCEDIMLEIIREVEISTSDYELLSTFASRLFNTYTDGDMSVAMGGLVQEVIKYRNAPIINEVVTTMMRFDPNIYEKSTRDKKIQKFQKTINKLIDFMGGNIGTIEGNQAKEYLSEMYLNADKYLLPDPPTRKPSKTAILNHLRSLDLPGKSTEIETFLAKI